MSLKYRLMSDLHLEFGDIDIPVLDREDKMVLVLAGDVALASYSETYVRFIKKMCSRHNKVIWIMGNHEYYKNYIDGALDEIKDNFKPIPKNLYILESGIVIVDDVAFVCATLWTDYNKEDPISMLESRIYMNDHVMIYKNVPPLNPYGSRNTKFLPEDALCIHKVHRKFIFSDDVKNLDVRAKVLVTHHGFSYLSIADVFKEEKHLNGAFVSECGYEIMDMGFNMAVHGHSHFSFDYMIGNCHVIANPRGYVSRNNSTGLIENENSKFDPNLVIDV